MGQLRAGFNDITQDFPGVVSFLLDLLNKRLGMLDDVEIRVKHAAQTFDGAGGLDQQIIIRLQTQPVAGDDLQQLMHDQPHLQLLQRQTDIPVNEISDIGFQDITVEPVLLMGNF